MYSAFFMYCSYEFVYYAAVHHCTFNVTYYFKVQQLAISSTVRRTNLGGGKIFHTHPNWPWGPPSLLQNRYQVSCPGVKQTGCGVDHPLLSSAEVTESVELYLYSPSGPSRPVSGQTLTLYYLKYV